ncbi:uncharacterized protein CANTADRAFT_47674 [Suhomyces tanzawaensis NRRL Y-17324]|uniref:Very-long-chain (3R)-3-hydroxyacyl-CoA dehydratase n=1 Tax=Suhomyces tanzawaensis NRRL Y-17324 TaxID=984487 RepID=A0A1E4SM61_9ASCO|nr:uncharacterized protein CANTADRAFT_47674 [Suhomyces tanzawaensis NRRL Y-17324]ODV80601.1 membrane protein [Suhomyces tanzawaensis NRRL Y-17324]
MSVTAYLTAYNAVSLVLWSYLLYTARLFHNYSIRLVGKVPHRLLVQTQVFNSGIEIFHSLLGLVATPVATMILQSLARLLIVVGICWKLPQSPGNYHFWAFTGIQLAWGITEVVRYGFYVLKLVGVRVPRWLTWLRYSTFIVLYPLGLVSELTVVYLSLGSASGLYYYFLVFALAMYIPGFLRLYGHMFKQRRKALARR